MLSFCHCSPLHHLAITSIYITAIILRLLIYAATNPVAAANLWSCYFLVRVAAARTACTARTFQDDRPPPLARYYIWGLLFTKSRRREGHWYSANPVITEVTANHRLSSWTVRVLPVRQFAKYPHPCRTVRAPWSTNSISPTTPAMCSSSAAASASSGMCETANCCTANWQPD